MAVTLEHAAKCLRENGDPNHSQLEPGGRVPGGHAAQRALLAEVDAGRIPKEEFFARAEALLKERTPAAAAHKPAEPKARPPLTVPAAASQPSAAAH